MLPRYYPLDGKYIRLPRPDNHMEIADRLQGGCLMDDLMLENKVWLRGQSAANDAMHKALRN